MASVGSGGLLSTFLSPIGAPNSRTWASGRKIGSPDVLAGSASSHIACRSPPPLYAISASALKSSCRPSTRRAAPLSNCRASRVTPKPAAAALLMGSETSPVTAGGMSAKARWKTSPDAPSRCARSTTSAGMITLSEKVNGVGALPQSWLCVKARGTVMRIGRLPIFARTRPCDDDTVSPQLPGSRITFQTTDTVVACVGATTRIVGVGSTEETVAEDRFGASDTTSAASAEGEAARHPRSPRNAAHRLDDVIARLEAMSISSEARRPADRRLHKDLVGRVIPERRETVRLLVIAARQGKCDTGSRFARWKRSPAYACADIVRGCVRGFAAAVLPVVHVARPGRDRLAEQIIDRSACGSRAHIAVGRLHGRIAFLHIAALQGRGQREFASDPKTRAQLGHVRVGIGGECRAFFRVADALVHRPIPACVHEAGAQRRGARFPERPLREHRCRFRHVLLHVEPACAERRLAKPWQQRSLPVRSELQLECGRIARGDVVLTRFGLRQERHIVDVVGFAGAAELQIEPRPVEVGERPPQIAVGDADGVRGTAKIRPDLAILHTQVKRERFAADLLVVPWRINDERGVRTARFLREVAVDDAIEVGVAPVAVEVEMRLRDLAAHAQAALEPLAIAGDTPGIAVRGGGVAGDAAVRTARLIRPFSGEVSRPQHERLGIGKRAGGRDDAFRTVFLVAHARSEEHTSELQSPK